MKLLKKENIISMSFGVLIGIVNGLLGAGGGMIAVPVLKKIGMDQRNAHANAVAVILPITAISVFLYVQSGNVKLSDAYPYIPGGLVGALAGSFILSKISPSFLKRIFGGFMIWAGVRLLVR